MLEPLTGLLLTRQQYASLAPGDAHREPVFPSWVEWNKLQMRAAGAAMRQGPPPQPWTIDVEAFHTWCARMGASPSIDELRIYCRMQGARQPWRPTEGFSA
ncbi:MAG: hypothetical protein KF891_11785 [Rhizobacter sp.]|nr:hypothetical protein [Rhizobacter sp.]